MDQLSIFQLKSFSFALLSEPKPQSIGTMGCRQNAYEKDIFNCHLHKMKIKMET